MLQNTIKQATTGRDPVPQCTDFFERPGLAHQAEGGTVVQVLRGTLAGSAPVHGKAGLESGGVQVLAVGFGVFSSVVAGH